jgi:hypothetical protein
MSSTSSIPVQDKPESSPATREWDLTGWIPDKSKVCDYGYVIKGQALVPIES